MATQHLILPRRKVSSGDDVAPSPRPVTTPMPSDFIIPTIPDLPGGLGQDAVFNRQEQLVHALEVWNRGLSPDVRKKKYAKMKYAASDKGVEPSPFAVYRATDHLFWQDLSHDARLHLFGNTKTHTWLSGDCHCCNLGSFHNRKGETVYALNDFDESLVADYQMDLWRLAVSILLAMNQVGVGNSEQNARDVIRTLGRAYRAAAVEHRAEKGAIFTSLNTTGRLQAFLRAVEGSKKFRYKKLFKKWTEDGRAERFDLISNAEKLHRCQPAEAEIVRKALEEQYAQRLGLRIRVRDVAQRLYQGLGAFGLKRFYAIVDLVGEGERNTGNGEGQIGGEQGAGTQTRRNREEQNGGEVGGEEDGGEKDGNNYKGRIILDVKLQPQASAYHFMRLDERVAFRKRYENDAKRTADAAKVLMSDADPYLGWIEITADDAESFVGWTDGFYSVREISPKKSSYPVLPADAKGPLKELALKDTEGFKEMAEQWGRVLAVSHAQAAAALEGKTEGRPDFSVELERLTAGESMEEFEDLLWGVVSHHAKLVAEDYDTFAKYVYPYPPEVEQPVGSDDEA